MVMLRAKRSYIRPDIGYHASDGRIPAGHGRATDPVLWIDGANGEGRHFASRRSSIPQHVFGDKRRGDKATPGDDDRSDTTTRFHGEFLK
jgi:hypothetical protein